MIFAREITDPLTSLVKKIDAATAEHTDAKMGSFIVFLSDDKSLESALKNLATKEHIEHTVLSIGEPAGPKGYNVSPDADVTVVLYTKRNVKANFAYQKGELTPADVDTIVQSVSKILPEKK